MAGYVSVGKYDATVRIPTFMGLYQGGDQMSGDPRYAFEAVNVDTESGSLRPAAMPILLPQRLGAPIETLVRFVRRWAEGTSRTGELEGKEMLVAASGGKLYWTDAESTVWTELSMPEGVAEYQSNHWSCVTYEENPPGAENPIDVLLMSNTKDGMICVHGDDMRVTKVTTPKKFGRIVRSNERVWGGAIEEDPDMLVYSAVYDAMDWEQNSEIPEDGAGDIQQPSWDGDSFTALVPFGQQLVAFKGTRAWRIIGTDPGEYTFQEQFGGGTRYPDTIAVQGYAALMMGDDSLRMYDGSSVFDYMRGYADDIFRRITPEAKHKATACIYKGVYYLALALDGDLENGAVLKFNTREKTFLLYEGVHVNSFVPCQNALYFCTSTEPGRLYRWGENAEESGAMPCRWVSLWMDMGAKDVQKGGFTAYVAPDTPLDAEIELTIETERKTKTKKVKLLASDKYKRVQISAKGRRFRYIIESKGRTAWAFKGGIQLTAEIDQD